MRILITGNLGYIGPVVVGHLRARFPNADLVGFDSGFYADTPAGAAPMPNDPLTSQYIGDVRDLPDALLLGTDAIVYLSAISNDPMGSRFEDVTDAINHRACLDLAKRAHLAGVGGFVLASSCSVYGFSPGAGRKEYDAVAPITAYARSKIGAETALMSADLEGMTITCLRFATACGFSPRLRLDLVLNDFVASAGATREIVVLSDGSPWRPLIEVRDMARAIEWAILRDAGEQAGGAKLVVNTGSDEWNYTVKELACAVAAQMGEITVSINASAPPDKRSYKVDFQLFRSLAPDHQPQVTLTHAIKGLLDGLDAMDFSDRDFRKSSLIRLNRLTALLDDGQLSADLRWTSNLDPSHGSVRHSSRFGGIDEQASDASATRIASVERQEAASAG